MRVSEKDINMVRNSPVTLREGMEGQGINEIFLKEERFFSSCHANKASSFHMYLHTCL